MATFIKREDLPNLQWQILMGSHKSLTKPCGLTEGCALSPSRDGKRQKGYQTSSFDCLCHFPLVFGAIPGYAAWNYLAPLGDKVSKQLCVLVIQYKALVHTESANLSALVWSCSPVISSHKTFSPTP